MIMLFLLHSLQSRPGEAVLPQSAAAAGSYPNADTVAANTIAKAKHLTVCIAETLLIQLAEWRFAGRNSIPGDR
jgi:hypothetical protein